MINSICVIVVCLAVTCLAQTCTFTPQGFFDMFAFQKCVQNMPLDPQVQARTVDTIRKTIPVYVFRDAVKNSPPSNGLVHVSVDLQTEINRIAMGTYNSDFDFHTDIANVFHNLKDPHTVYIKPQCYYAFVTQPLAFGSRLNADGKQEIYVFGTYGTTAAQQYANFPLQSYVGAVVQTIDGTPALDFVVAYSKLYGFLSKDPGALFNHIMGFIQFRPLAYFPFPPANTQAYTLLTTNGDVVNVQLPWVVVTNPTITFSGTTCTATTNKRGMLEPKGIELLELFKVPESFAPKTTLSSPIRMRQITPSVAAVPNDIFVYSVSPQVVALKITDFVPNNNDDFLGVVNTALNLGLQQNAPYLILDVRGNGGGDICLGYEVINRLVNERHPEGRYDVIHSDLTLALAKAGLNINTPFYSPQWWNKPDGSLFQDISWYNPGVSFNRGDTLGAYSERVYHACTYPNNPPVYLFQKIAVLSDGQCGSTCAVFTSHLDEVDSVITVALGGIAGTDMQYFSFPGGQVMELPGLQSYASFLGVKNQTIVPAALPTTAILTFAALEIYPWFKNQTVNLPLEFVFRAANHRLDLWPIGAETIAQQEALYNEVSKVFTQ